MRSIDRLEQQRRMRRMKNNQPPPDEETEEELERPRFLPLNKTKTAFGDPDDGPFGGINSAPSVFSKSALFRDE